MTQLSILTNNGTQVVRMGMQNLTAEIPQVGRLQIYRTSQRIVSRMKIYPPERMGQKYIRTYNLQRSWEIISRSNGYTIRNNASFGGKTYAKYPVGNAYGLEQAWMHTGRWQKFRDVNDEEVSKLPPELDGLITQVARRVGL